MADELPKYDLDENAERKANSSATAWEEKAWLKIEQRAARAKAAMPSSTCGDCKWWKEYSMLPPRDEPLCGRCMLLAETRTAYSACDHFAPRGTEQSSTESQENKKDWLETNKEKLYPMPRADGE